MRLWIVLSYRFVRRGKQLMYGLEYQNRGFLCSVFRPISYGLDFLPKDNPS